MTDIARPVPSGARALAGAGITVHELDANDSASWSNYVAQHPRATVFHTLRWMRGLETLGHRRRYLFATSRRRVVGLLPLFHCTGVLFRSELLSLPHTNFAGPLVDGDRAERALIATAEELAAQLGARAIVLKDRYPSAVERPRVDSFVTFERELPRAAGEVLASFDKGARYWVRRAESRHRLTVDFERDLDAFYRLLAASYRRLGTPLYPRRFFETLLGEFGEDAVLIFVRCEGVPVASVFALRYRDTLTSLFSGEAPGARALGVNPLKYCRLMEWAVERGIARYNFGRSRLTNPGIIAFKRHLGFDATPLPYRVVPGAEAIRPTDPNRGFYRFATRAWSRLPRGFTERVGPSLVRLFPD